MTYEVRIFLKDGLLDPAAVTIERALKRLNFSEIGGLRTGKVFLIETDAKTSRERVEQMCAQLLANPVMERFEIREVTA